MPRPGHGRSAPRTAPWHTARGPTREARAGARCARGGLSASGESTTGLLEPGVSQLGFDRQHHGLHELLLPGPLLPRLVGVAPGLFEVLFEDPGHAPGEGDVVYVEARLVVEPEAAQ